MSNRTCLICDKRLPPYTPSIVLACSTACHNKLSDTDLRACAECGQMVRVGTKGKRERCIECSVLRNRDSIARAMGAVARTPELVARMRAATARHYEKNKAQRLLDNRAHAKTFARRHPEVARAKYEKRRAMVHGAFVEPVTLADVWGDGLCGICGQRVDASLKFPDPQSATVDHIRALARGGLHALANCQLAHFLCNSKKGAR